MSLNGKATADNVAFGLPLNDLNPPDFGSELGSER